MKFIGLTRLDDAPTLINIDHIVAVSAPISAQQFDTAAGALIHTVDGRFQAVTETVDEVRTELMKATYE